MTTSLHFGRRTVRVGGLSREELLSALAAAGVRLNASAERLLDDPMFTSGEARAVQSVDVVEQTVGQLGLTDGATLVDILAAAEEQGLLRCPPYAGPYLRLAMLDQPAAPDSILSNGRPPSGAVHVASARLRREYDYPRGFYLRVVDATPWLRGYRCTDESPWSAGDRFAFRSPGVVQTEG
ncbi:MAG TPA: hypothetical protein VFM08_11625 [Nocardioides sp.]|nr:hypothetical protein [Nocardioides sp.]